MHFLAPYWFYLIPAVLLLGMVWKRIRLFQPLRILAVVLIATILAQPTIHKQQDSLELWVLLDRSDSTEGLVAKNLPEWKKLLREKQNRKDSLRFVDYAAEVVEQIEHSETAIYTGNRKLTRTALAIENVLALASEDRPSRILIFTDGYSTEPFDDLANKLNKAGIPVDYRLVREETTDDFRVARIDLPSRAESKEPFILGITVRGHEDGKVPITIYRDGTPISPAGTSVELVNGVGKLEFTTRLIRPGSYKFSATIMPDKDAHTGNNTAHKWIQITGGPQVLIVTKYKADPLVASLRSQGITVDAVMQPANLKIGQLSGAKAVIFNNIPAHEIPNKFLDALNFYVREQGGGFMMVGGKHSFGSGGYFQSSIDPLLPISMELKNDHRKLAVAMAIVMDRSGSMGMTVPSAAGKTITKMQLANNGAATAIDLLGYYDSVAVYAVDSETETVVRQQQIGSNKEKLKKKAMRVQAGGGGIFVYTGLKDAWDRLKKVPIGTKHIILFTDAADSEEPGDYKRLIAEMNKAGATISVIGLGTKKDADAKFIEDIAKRGKGRIFFTQRAADIPKLFAQETVTIARSAFIEEPVKTLPTGLWTEISPEPIQWMPKVGGYNLSYSRPESTTSLISVDEYKAPLIAHAHKGIGRSVAISFPLGGEHSAEVRNWKQYGNFVQTITRWLMGDKLPPGIGIRHHLDGTRLKVDLLYDTDAWAQKFALHPPKIKIISGDHGGESNEIAWQRIAPGQFSLTQDLEEGTMIRGSIIIGKYAIPFGPIVVGSSTEWAFDSERLNELRTLSHQTGGRQLTDLSKAWLRPPMLHYADLRPPLTIALLIIILIDALLTRTGWKLPEFDIFKRRKTTKPKSKSEQEIIPSFSSTTAAITPNTIPNAVAETKSATPKAKSATPKDLPDPDPTLPPSNRQSRFSRAKSRKH